MVYSDHMLLDPYSSVRIPEQSACLRELLSRPTNANGGPCSRQSLEILQTLICCSHIGKVGWKIEELETAVTY